MGAKGSTNHAATTSSDKIQMSSRDNEANAPHEETMTQTWPRAMLGIAP